MLRPVVRHIVPLTSVLVTIGTLAIATKAWSSDVRTTMSIAQALESLPCYGVFDHLTFTVHHGTVTLDGYAYDGSLATQAVATVERLPGVTRVVTTVQPLPTSAQDEWIRLAVFHRVYEEDFLSRYAPGSHYAIHIVVRGGHVLLAGVVESNEDKEEAVLRARAVVGTFAVDNALTVAQR